MQRLKTRVQFQAVMDGGATVARTEHFALHRAGLGPQAPTEVSTGPGPAKARALFAVMGEPWIGAILPKRWARRAVTRNTLKRQIYAVSLDFEDRLPAAAHVVRLRAGFDKTRFHSATSDLLKAAVRAELQRLFAGARA